MAAFGRSVAASSLARVTTRTGPGASTRITSREALPLWPGPVFARLGVRRRMASLTLLAYTTLSAALFLRVWINPLHSISGVSVDPGLSIWFLGWDADALVHHRSLFVTTWLNAPHGVNSMWNASELLLGVLLAPVTRLAGPVLTYNILATAALALSAWCAFLALRRWSSPPGAFVGGLLYGFSPYMINHSLGGHLNLTFAFFPPLLLMLGAEIVVDQRRSAVVDGALLGLLLAAQLLIGEEIIALSAIAAVIAVALLGILHPGAVSRTYRHVLVATGVALGTALLLTAYPLYVQFFGPMHIRGVVNSPLVYGSDLVSFVLPPRDMWLGGHRFAGVTSHFSGNLYESAGYLGVPLLFILVAYAVRRWGNPNVRWAALTAAVLAVLSVGYVLRVAGIDVPLPTPAGKLMARLPIVDNVMPIRLMLFVYLLAAFLLARLIDDLGRRRGAAVGVTLAVLLPLIPSGPIGTSSTTVPRFFNACESSVPYGSTVVVAPWAWTGDSSSMIWQAEGRFRFRMPGAYATIGDEKATYGAQRTSTGRTLVGIEWSQPPQLTKPTIDGIRAELRQWRVARVVVGPMPHRSAALSLFQHVFGVGGRDECGVTVWTVPA